MKPGSARMKVRTERETSRKTCSICGEQKVNGRAWFLIAPSLSEDQLNILAWQDEVACRPGVHSLCCAAHVSEMVLEWMVGTPSFIVPEVPGKTPPGTAGVRVLSEPNVRGARQIAELWIDRDAVERALARNPSSLQLLLDELRDVLDREVAGAESRLESADTTPWLRQM